MSNLRRLEIGDKFMRKSKYGVVFGVVADIYGRVIIVEGQYKYVQIHIKSTNGVEYEYNECYGTKLLATDRTSLQTCDKKPNP